MTEYTLEYSSSEDYEGGYVDIGFAKIHYPKLFAKWLILVIIFCFCLVLLKNQIKRLSL